MSDNKEKDGRKTAGYILLGVAAYIILSNSGFLDFLGIRAVIGFLVRSVFNLIPVGLVVLGVYLLNKTKDDSTPMIPWFLIVFGAVLLISQFDLFGLDFGDMFLPLWLVFIAMMLLNPGKLLPRGLNSHADDISAETSAIRLFAFMGGGDLTFTSRQLQGGEVVAIWGGYKMDLTQAEMEGDVMELQLFCIMGGVEIIIPPNWEVEKQAIMIMGGFSDKTNCLAEKLDLPRKKLIIKGLALMGGGDIKN